MTKIDPQILFFFFVESMEISLRFFFLGDFSSQKTPVSKQKNFSKINLFRSFLDLLCCACDLAFENCG